MSHSIFPLQKLVQLWFTSCQVILLPHHTTETDHYCREEEGEAKSTVLWFTQTLSYQIIMTGFIFLNSHTSVKYYALTVFTQTGFLSGFGWRRGQNGNYIIWWGITLSTCTELDSVSSKVFGGGGGGGPPPPPPPPKETLPEIDTTRYYSNIPFLPPLDGWCDSAHVLDWPIVGSSAPP